MTASKKRLSPVEGQLREALAALVRTHPARAFSSEINTGLWPEIARAEALLATVPEGVQA